MKLGFVLGLMLGAAVAAGAQSVTSRAIEGVARVLAAGQDPNGVVRTLKVDIDGRALCSSESATTPALPTVIWRR